MLLEIAYTANCQMQYFEKMCATKHDTRNTDSDTVSVTAILSLFSGYDNKDCPGQVTYSVGQVKISVACPTRQGVIIFFIDSIIFQFKH